jgi:hypothetical protein
MKLNKKKMQQKNSRDPDDYDRIKAIEDTILTLEYSTGPYAERVLAALDILKGVLNKTDKKSA